MTHGITVKFGLWTFHKLVKRQKNLILVTFGCPSYNPWKECSRLSDFLRSTMNLLFIGEVTEA